MSDYQARVIEEFEELSDRLVKLQAFITSSPVHAALPDDERTRLAAQCAAMTTYAYVLLERIKAFGGLAA
ncbi:crAss001_48 related protein [Paraburkholderia phosphatilytica]|uniref:crAss001_48 related protein n=1 Tax=Paraburkholderia phosphatilytica TaxID=2282883 RepID=UPI000E4BAE2A